jgi:GNAT superfamily N-acetyltransferase
MAPPVVISDVGNIEPGGELSNEIARCWMDVANTGGAVGLPFVPVELEAVRQAVTLLESQITLGRRSLTIARMDSELVGWVSVWFNDSPLTRHWGKIQHLQSHPSRRGVGVGSALLEAACKGAASRGLEQLILTLRGGEQLEPFYEQAGWQEIGRHDGALRFGDADDRDEVLMRINL